ncbi:unnamed protein product [Adineta ricciae]|uniref:Uncharacterized protein n=1 Tax=Adineta ricciae TaxID=249248 RepID=A0A816EEM7_ADIRI|nr:unnamed protein product [Adineta ricciae]
MTTVVGVQLGRRSTSALHPSAAQSTSLTNSRICNTHRAGPLNVTSGCTNTVTDGLPRYSRVVSTSKQLTDLTTKIEQQTTKIDGLIETIQDLTMSFKSFTEPFNSFTKSFQSFEWNVKIHISFKSLHMNFIVQIQGSQTTSRQNAKTRKE